MKPTPPSIDAKPAASTPAIAVAAPAVAVVEAADPALPPHPTLSRYYQRAEDRQARVTAMFDATAEHYELVTKVMSFGSGDWYRKQALVRHGVGLGMTVLDIGSGTGSLARSAQSLVGEGGLVAAVDPSIGMLRDSRQRGSRQLLLGRGEQLPLAGASCDRVVMGFALRHVPDLLATFREYHRVLKPGGRVLLLEWTPPQRGVGRALLGAYLKFVVPSVAFVITGSGQVRELMRYYWDTIDHCVPPDTILAALSQSGFVRPERHQLLGMFSEYSAVKEP